MIIIIIVKACVPKPVHTLAGEPALALPLWQVFQVYICAPGLPGAQFQMYLSGVPGVLCLCRLLYLPRFARSTLRIVSRLPGKRSFKIAHRSLRVTSQI